MQSQFFKPKYDEQNIKNCLKHPLFLTGFTLVETIVVLFVGTMLIMALFTFYDWHSKLFNYQQAVVNVSGSGRTIMQALHTYTTQANRVLSSQSINGTTYTTGANALVLKLPSIDSNGNGIVGTYDYVAFYLSGTSMYQDLVKNGASVRRPGKKLLSSVVLSLAFTYDNANYDLVKQVTADLQTQEVVQSHIVKDHLTEVLYLKNH